MSLAIVGADYPNPRGPARRFEIAVCHPGEPVTLKREPRNKHDSRAIGVYSVRDVQIGYVRAEQAQMIGSAMDSITAVFQRPDTWGAVIRISFDGTTPVLPVEKPRPARHRPGSGLDEEWPPPEPRDDFGGL